MQCVCQSGSPKYNRRENVTQMCSFLGRCLTLNDFAAIFYRALFVSASARCVSPLAAQSPVGVPVPYTFCAHCRREMNCNSLDARPVLRLQHAIDTHQPVFGGVRFLDVRQVEVFVADFGAARAVEARRRAIVELHLAKSLTKRSDECIKRRKVKKRTDNRTSCT